MAKLTLKRILGSATLLIFIISGTLIGLGPQAQAADRFSDVVDEDLNKVYIDYIISEGIMNGFPDCDFHPGEVLTRAQAAVIMCNAFQRKINYDADSGFIDVPLSHWSATYIKASAESGYLNRLPENIYNPDEALTRAEGICMLLGLSKQNYTGIKLAQVSDMDESHWAAPAIALALDAGMIQMEKGALMRPDSPMTRSELCRALAVLLTSDPGLYESKLIGTLTVKSGAVWIGRMDRPGYDTVTGSLPVKAGDIIETRNDGEAVIEYPDGSRLLLKSNSYIKVKESMGRNYIKKGGTNGIAVDNLELECPYGEVYGSLSTLTCEKDSTDAATLPWYKTASQTSDKIKFNIPGGVFSIHGTTFYLGCSSSTCTVLEGSGAVSTGEGTVDLSNFQQFQLISGETVQQAKVIEQPIVQEMVNNKSFILESIAMQQQQKAASVQPQRVQERITRVCQQLQHCLQVLIRSVP